MPEDMIRGLFVRFMERENGTTVEASGVGLEGNDVRGSCCTEEVDKDWTDGNCDGCMATFAHG